MPDARDDAGRGREGDPLIGALRSMPLAGPQTDAWPELAARLGLAARIVRTRKPRRSRFAWPVAVAAALLVALLLRPAVMQRPATDPVLEPAVVADANPGETKALIAQSQWLERLVQSEAIDSVAQNGDQLLLELGLRERIRQIDGALAGSEGDRQARLWQARVGALSQLAEVKWAARQSDWAQDATGRQVPAASYVTWSN